ncbi:MAG TPA: SRPBCC domain-containing protein [Terracidiphilus sp.]
MVETQLSIEDMTVNIEREIHVQASLKDTFEALLEQVGSGNENPDGTKMPMVLEPWPGGRWYRDLGDGNGHFWAHVQAIKRPTLLEFSGPLFASYPFSSNVQYRLSEESGGTVIKFRHVAFGLVDPQHRAGMNKGWNWILDQVKQRAETGK